MLEILRVEREMRLEGSALRFDVSKNIQALLVPAEFPSTHGRQDDDQEAVWDVSDPWRSRLQAFLDLAQDHYYRKGAKGHCTSNFACFGRMAEKKHDLIQAAAMGC